MSDLYKSAIADAKLLREAAIKSVESVILEKYSGDIKQAVDEVLSGNSDELYEANETEDENVDKKSDKNLFGPNGDGSPTNDLPNPDNLGSLTDTADVGTDLSANSDDPDSQDPMTADVMNSSGDAEAKQDATAEDDSFPDMPDQAMDGESVSGAVQTNGEIEIDLSELEAMANSKPNKVQDVSQDTQSHESILPDMGGSENSMEEPLKEAIDSDEEAPKEDHNGRKLIIDDEVLEQLAEALMNETDDTGASEAGALIERYNTNNEYDDSDEREERRRAKEEYDEGWADREHDRHKEGDDEYDDLDESVEDELSADKPSNTQLVEDYKENLLEDIDFDFEEVPSGNINGNFGGVPEPEKRFEKDRMAAAKNLKDKKDEETKRAALMEAVSKEVDKKVKKLSVRLNALEQKNQDLVNENQKLATDLKNTSTKLLETITNNSKLHYANRILRDGSLNEQQRNKLVESLKKANSAEEAKSIFETAKSLVESVGSTRGSVMTGKAPSLNEVLANRNRTKTFNSSGQNDREEEGNPISSSIRESWKKIAGIKN